MRTTLFTASVLTAALTATAVTATVLAAPAPQTAPPEKKDWSFAADAGWSEEGCTAQRAYEDALNAIPDSEQLASWHDRLCSEPHIAGTDGDARTIERLIDAFEEMGLEVERHDIWVYMSYPKSARVEIVTPEAIELPVRERVLDEDPQSGHPDLPFGFNAYAKTGDVTGEIVYANYATKEDFRQLRNAGIDVAGKIVLARYGGNHRGYKVRFAEEAGAIGVLIYTDPADSGHVRGAVYPEGGYANETYIQRGSVVTKPYPGDPLTPRREARERAGRMDPKEVDLPGIPSQPIGYGAAQQIMKRMEGEEIPETLRDAWTGGMPCTYKATGGATLTVRVAIEQTREIRKTSNVIATLRGERFPDEIIIAGCHHDAWGFGAADPAAGLICLLECARSFATEAEQGRRPDRTIKFAAWAAEEFGVIGSTEWCEANQRELFDGGVAYINLDMAAMGTNFGASPAPLLKNVIEQATMVVPQPGGADGETVHDRWTANGSKPANIRSLGGGSDHLGFYCRMCIPSCGLGARGAKGVAYHSNYDTLYWYRKIVGDDYLPARMVSRVTNVTIARLANSDVHPYDPVQYGADLYEYVQELHRTAPNRGLSGVRLGQVAKLVRLYGSMSAAVWPKVLDAAREGRLTDEQLVELNARVRKLERSLFVSRGLSEPPWFRSLFMAPDPTSGYAAWPIPEMRWVVEERKKKLIGETVDLYETAVKRLVENMRYIEIALQPND